MKIPTLRRNRLRRVDWMLRGFPRRQVWAGYGSSGSAPRLRPPYRPSSLGARAMNPNINSALRGGINAPAFASEFTHPPTLARAKARLDEPAPFRARRSEPAPPYTPARLTAPAPYRARLTVPTPPYTHAGGRAGAYTPASVRRCTPHTPEGG